MARACCTSRSCGGQEAVDYRLMAISRCDANAELDNFFNLLLVSLYIMQII